MPISMTNRRYETLLNAFHAHPIADSHLYTSHAYPCTYTYTYAYAKLYHIKASDLSK